MHGHLPYDPGLDRVVAIAEAAQKLTFRRRSLGIRFEGESEFEIGKIGLCRCLRIPRTLYVIRGPSQGGGRRKADDLGFSPRRLT